MKWNPWIVMYLVISASFHSFSTGNLSITKLANRKKKKLTHEIFRRKNFGQMKYPRVVKCFDSQTTQEKNIWTHEIPKIEDFRPTKYPRENISNS